MSTSTHTTMTAAMSAPSAKPKPWPNAAFQFASDESVSRVVSGGPISALAGCNGDEEAAVLVVRREEVRAHHLRHPGPRAER